MMLNHNVPRVKMRYEAEYYSVELTGRHYRRSFSTSVEELVNRGSSHERQQQGEFKLRNNLKRECTPSHEGTDFFCCLQDT